MKTKVMEIITYKKQTSKTKYIIEVAFEYKPQFFFRKKIQAAASIQENMVNTYVQIPFDIYTHA